MKKQKRIISVNEKSKNIKQLTEKVQLMHTVKNTINKKIESIKRNERN